LTDAGLLPPFTAIDGRPACSSPACIDSSAIRSDTGAVLIRLDL
jgi:hypothetical protein